MTNTSREVGGVLGIAVLGTILTTKLKSAFAPALTALGLSAQQQAAIGEAASHGTLDPTLLRGLAPETQLKVTEAFGSAFMDGFRLALLTGAAVLLLAAVVAYVFIPSGGHHREDADPGQPVEHVAVEV
jgi:hypothetical protein